MANTTKKELRNAQSKIDELGHAIWHVLECDDQNDVKQTKLCPDCRAMLKHVLKLTGWKFE